MNAYRSAIAAGYSHHTAIQAHRALERRLNFPDLLVKQGLDDDTVVQVLKDGLEATRIKSSGEVPDHVTRHKFLETLLRLRGDLQAEVVNQTNTQVVIVREERVIDGDSCSEERLPRSLPVVPE